MGVPFDHPDELDRLAIELTAHAQRLRDRADDQVRRADEAHWVSASARVYRDLAADDRDRAHRVADDLVDAAARLRVHALQARDTLSLVRGWLEVAERLRERGVV